DLDAVVAVAEGGAAADVGADEVALEGIVAGVAAAVVAQEDAVVAVAGDQVAHPGARAAHGVVGGAVDDVDAGADVGQAVGAGAVDELDAVAAVGEAVGAGDVGADVVALHRVVAAGTGAEVAHEDAVGAVARNQVARARPWACQGQARAADEVVVGAVEDRHAGEGVVQGDGAGRVGADEVAREGEGFVRGGGAGGWGATEVAWKEVPPVGPAGYRPPAPAVGRDHVALARGRPADEVPRRAVGERDADPAVAQAGGAGHVG